MKSLTKLRAGVLASVFLAIAFGTSTALAGSGVGGVFNLGQTNSVNGTSTLTGTTAGRQFSVLNASTASTGVGVYGQSASPTSAGVYGVNLAGGPGIQSNVKTGVPPLRESRREQRDSGRELPRHD